MKGNGGEGNSKEDRVIGAMEDPVRTKHLERLVSECFGERINCLIFWFGVDWLYWEEGQRPWGCSG